MNIRLFAATLVLALAAWGCSGQQLEGRWQGSFPFEGATGCVLNLYSNREFNLSCAGDSWIGGGRYHQDGGDLTFEFKMLHHHRDPVAQPPTLTVQLAGQGNKINLTNATHQSFTLERKL